MKTLLRLILFSVFSASAIAAEIIESDAGTYLSKLKDGTSKYFVLSKIDGKWSWKDKEPGGLLSAVHCLSDCEYRNTTEADNQKLIPAEHRQFQDMACIKNISFAFCRLSQKRLPACGSPEDRGGIGNPCRLGPESKPDNANYILFAVFGNKPALIPISRAEPQ